MLQTLSGDVLAAEAQTHRGPIPARIPIRKPSAEVVAAERLEMIVDASRGCLKWSARSPKPLQRIGLATVERILQLAELPLPAAELVERLRDALPFLGEGYSFDGEGMGTVRAAFRDPTPSQIRYRMSRVRPMAYRYGAAGRVEVSFDRTYRALGLREVAR